MKFHSTVLFVKDIEKSKDFYTRYLGFTVEQDFGKNVIFANGLTIWEIRPGHPVGELSDAGSKSKNFELYFEEEDIESIYNKLYNSGMCFFQKIHEETWGQRTFRFFDPDRHLIEIGEPLEVFVRNMSRKGISPERICEISGIPLDTVEELLRKGK